jgi:hypothetical protein
MKVFTSKQFIEKLKWLVNDVPNVYYSGTNWSKLNSKEQWQFDCVVSIKSILWGFKADKKLFRGGTVYKSNGVADFTCNGGLNYCTDVSKDFTKLVPGSYLCMKGTKYNHSGICLVAPTSTKRGKVFECTTGWGTGKCIISEIDTKGNRYYNGVKNVPWTWNGKLIWIDYTTPPQPLNQVKILQVHLNEQWHLGLAEDGIFGVMTRKACKEHYLQYHTNAPIMVQWLQQRLNELGYKLDVDRIFGPKTRTAVKDFQKKKHLAVDGICGECTYKALTE